MLISSPDDINYGGKEIIDFLFPCCNIVLELVILQKCTHSSGKIKNVSNFF